MAIATKAPMTTIHHGIDAGRLKASSRPVTTAERFPTVGAPRSMKRWIRYSNATQHATDSAVTLSTLQPKSSAETTSAGNSATITSRMIFVVDSALWTCGDGATRN